MQKKEIIIKGTIPKNFRLLIIKDDYSLWFYNGEVRKSTKGFNFVKHLDFERGAILDVFAQMEFLVNEIIRVFTLGIISEKDSYMDDILARIDFSGRIRLLRKWRLIKRKQEEWLIHLKKVRDGFAHRLDPENLEYRSKGLADNFNGFKKDMLAMFKELNNVYLNVLKKDDVEILKSIIKEKIKD